MCVVVVSDEQNVFFQYLGLVTIVIFGNIYVFFALSYIDTVDKIRVCKRIVLNSWHELHLRIFQDNIVHFPGWLSWKWHVNVPQAAFSHQLQCLFTLLHHFCLGPHFFLFFFFLGLRIICVDVIISGRISHGQVIEIRTVCRHLKLSLWSVCYRLLAIIHPLDFFLNEVPILPLFGMALRSDKIIFHIIKIIWSTFFIFPSSISRIVDLKLPEHFIFRWFWQASIALHYRPALAIRWLLRRWHSLLVLRFSSKSALMIITLFF